jgi:predicted HD superfamily hydrolase involved in NAD metabolism
MRGIWCRLDPPLSMIQRTILRRASEASRNAESRRVQRGCCMMNDAEELLRAALLKVPSGLAEHVIRVVDEARRLAATHGEDVRAATVAALGHDLLRAHSEERLLTIAEEQSYALDPAERIEPILLHGPLAVPILQERYNVLDADVLAAVAYHTTANEGMSRLQKIVFLADKIEPEKLGRYPDGQGLAALGERDLDAAMRMYLDFHVGRALESGWPLHSHTIAARNELIAASRAAEPGATLKHAQDVQSHYDS